MAEARMDKSDPSNPTASDSKHVTRRIPGLESDAFISRLKEVIGDRKLTWFASECGVGESTLRNILGGAWPRTDILVAMANAGGVTLDWLATGREPKTHAGRVSEAGAAGDKSLDDRLEALESALHAAPGIPATPDAELPADVAALRNALADIATSVDASPQQRTRADMHLRLAFSDQSAIERQRRREADIMGRVRDATQTVIRACNDLGFEAPAAWGALTQELIFAHGLTEAGAMRLLETVREMLQDSSKRPR